MERSIWAVTVATFALRFATGLTGALLIFFLAELPDHGGPEVGPLAVALFTALFFAAELVLSPPFGPACFWLKSVAPPEISLQEIFLAVLPFIGLQIIGLTLVMVFPEIVLVLPRVLGG